MLRDFTIQGFKLFQSLSLPSLGEVNLIVGRNNTGKTILLEALSLYASQGSPHRILEILQSRDEVLLDPPQESRLRFRDPYARISALFHGIPENVEGASFELRSATHFLRVSIIKWLPNSRKRSSLRTLATEDGDPILTEDGEQLLIEDIDTSELGLRISSGTQSYNVKLPLSLRGVEPLRVEGSVLVSVGGLSSRDITSWWDAFTLTAQEQEVYECLRLIAPVERLSLVGRPDSSSERMAMVKLYGKSQPIPLRSLGDGLRRIFHFAIALQRTRAGDLLLLDEIENGVHYTALPALWTVIIKAARAKGVQVFATTHSWDCVLGFQQASAQESASAHLIKLYEEKGSIKASIFNEKELSLVAREEIEVR